jgi:hypothetical protein
LPPSFPLPLLPSPSLPLPPLLSLSLPLPPLPSPPPTTSTSGQPVQAMDLLSEGTASVTADKIQTTGD